MITAISRVVVPVHEQERAKRFGTTRMGFELRHDQSYGDDERWIEVRPACASAGRTSGDLSRAQRSSRRVPGVTAAPALRLVVHVRESKGNPLCAGSAEVRAAGKDAKGGATSRSTSRRRCFGSRCRGATPPCSTATPRTRGPAQGAAGQGSRAARQRRARPVADAAQTRRGVRAVNPPSGPGLRAPAFPRRQSGRGSAARGHRGDDHRRRDRDLRAGRNSGGGDRRGQGARMR